MGTRMTGPLIEARDAAGAVLPVNRREMGINNLGALRQVAIHQASAA